MELRQLRTFQTIVEQGSYLRAAEVLGYTQSAVTAQIQQLERELGYPLFERLGRRMVLTAMGQEALQRVRPMLGLSEELLRLGGLSGVLRVDMGESLLCYRMQPVLRAFHVQAPEVELRLRRGSLREITEHVRTGQCDLGVGYDDPEWLDGPFTAEKLGSCRMSLLSAPDFPHQDFDTPHQRLKVALLADEPDSTFRRRLENYFHRQDILPGQTVELWSIETIKRCAMSGLGFAYLPCFAVEGELKSGQLVELPCALTGASSAILCIRHKNHALSPAMDLFLSLLQEHLS